MILTLYILGIMLPFVNHPEETKYQQTNTVYSGIILYNIELCNLKQYRDLVVDSNNVIEVEEQQEIIVDEGEVDLLARAIYWECGILGDEGMYLCGCVILNRVSSEEFPNDVYSVLYQNNNGRYQYDIVKRGLINKDADGNAYDIARELLINGSTIPEDVVYQAQFRQGSYVYKQIGNTYFCGL